MKLMRVLALVVCITAIAITGCGGDDTDGGGGGGGEPSAMSPATWAVLAQASFFQYAVAASIFPTAPPALFMSAKYAIGIGANITCDWTNSDFDCTMWDDRGSETGDDFKCDINGSLSVDLPQDLATFMMNFNCTNFSSEDNDEDYINGQWASTVKLNLGFAFNISMGSDTGFHVAKADTTEDCPYPTTGDACGQTYTDEEATCDVICGGTPLCDESAALSVVTWTAGTGGVVLTTTCGTFTITENSTSTDSICVGSLDDFTVSFDPNATINSTTINQNVDLDCVATT
jgi:hypothetical protein